MDMQSSLLRMKLILVLVRCPAGRITRRCWVWAVPYGEGGTVWDWVAERVLSQTLFSYSLPPPVAVGGEGVECLLLSKRGSHNTCGPARKLGMVLPCCHRLPSSQVSLGHLAASLPLAGVHLTVPTTSPLLFLLPQVVRWFPGGVNDTKLCTGWFGLSDVAFL